MKSIMTILLAASPMLTVADEAFEITQENCNRPLQEIRQIVTDREAQQKVLQQCTEKAMQERWRREGSQLISES